MNELNTILDGLIQRTADGRLKWSRSVPVKRFVASLDAISVAIQETERGGLSYSGEYRLEITNEKGHTVEVLDSEDQRGLVPVDRRATTWQSSQLERLYPLARRSALDTQSTLEKLAKALES